MMKICSKEDYCHSEEQLYDRGNYLKHPCTKK